MTTNRYLIYQTSIMIMIGVFLIGCSNSNPTPSPDQMDKSPFTGIPCASPCWHGLVIGKSSESDVMSTLPTLTFIDQGTIYVHQILSMPSLEPSIWTQGDEITASCIFPKKKCLTIRVVDNTLTEVVAVMNYNIRLDEAIKYLGNPDYVGYDRAGGEQMACTVYSIWRENQFVLASEKFEGSNAVEKNCYVVRDTGKISSSLLISEARYMSIKAIEILLSSPASEFFEFSGTLPEK
jgi:hypothetical protein